MRGLLAFPESANIRFALTGTTTRRTKAYRDFIDMFRLQRNVYLDNNATTPISVRVQKKMMSVLKRHYGNPSSQYQLGRDSAEIIEQARAQVAAAIGANAEQILFTGSATEANNQVIQALCQQAPADRRKIISSPIEHSSVIRTLNLAEKQGFEIVWLPVNRHGCIDMQAFTQHLDDNTLLVCCMLANNEIGTLQDIAEISRYTRRHCALLLVDCVQALAKVPINVNQLGMDYATFSAHKIHGPKGVGALYWAKGTPIAPLIHGGHQENGLRGGTECVHNIAGFGEACTEIFTAIDSMAAVHNLRNTLRDNLRLIAPNMIEHSRDTQSLPNTLSVTFPGQQNSVMLAALDLGGVSVSAGSACNTGGSQPSHVLKAIGLSDEEANATLRISLSTDTTVKDINYALKVFEDMLQGNTPQVQLVKPFNVDRDFLYNQKHYILDIRFEYERRLLKSMPHAHEVEFLSFKRYLHHIPKDKTIIIVCMGGIDAMALAYRLHEKGFKKIAVVLGGLAAWRLVQPELYKTLAGTNVERLSPKGKEK